MAVYFPLKRELYYEFVFHVLLFTLNFGACSLNYKLPMEMYLNGLFGLSPRRRTEGAS